MSPMSQPLKGAVLGTVLVVGAAAIGLALRTSPEPAPPAPVAQNAPPAGSEPQRVTFPSAGETLVGRLFTAQNGGRPAPAVAIIGPMTYQKEQAPTEYARRLAAAGFTSLVFDTRYRGESSGEPRNYEDPAAKVADLRAALDYLTARDDVDDTRVSVLGICMGSNQALVAAAADPRVGAVATVAAHFRDDGADTTWLSSEQAVADRLERGRQALEKYQRTGVVDYVPAVAQGRTDVGMPGDVVWGWYQPWADAGVWQNEYAVMSDAAMFGGFESLTSASALSTPYLMIHSDRSAVPDSARRHFAAVPTPDKKLVWEGETDHFQYYDDPSVLDRASTTIAEWFAAHPAR